VPNVSTVGLAMNNPRQCPSCGSGCGYTKTKGCQHSSPIKQRAVIGWVVWQNACGAMRTEMLKELREYLAINPVCSHKDIDVLLCEVTNPSYPEDKE